METTTTATNTGHTTVAMSSLNGLSESMADQILTQNSGETAMDPRTDKASTKIAGRVRLSSGWENDYKALVREKCSQVLLRRYCQ